MRQTAHSLLANVDDWPVGAAGERTPDDQSARFFRHIPALGMLPAGGQGFVKVVTLMLMLFALFCYSLELERLGKSIEWP